MFLHWDTVDQQLLEHWVRPDDAETAELLLDNKSVDLIF